VLTGALSQEVDDDRVVQLGPGGIFDTLLVLLGDSERVEDVLGQRASPRVDQTNSVDE